MEVVAGYTIREDVFLFLSKKSKLCRLTLTQEELLLQSINDYTIQCRYSIDDVFGCHVLQKRKSSSNEVAFLCFYLYPRSKKTSLCCSGDSRTTIKLIFEIRKEGNSYQKNLEEAMEWKKDILKLLCRAFPNWRHKTTNGNNIIENNENIDNFYETGIRLDHNVQQKKSLYNFATLFPFIRTYFVILNPKSGKGNAVNIFQKHVSPLLIESNVKVDLFVTEYPGHARTTMMNYDLSDIDGIVTIGGDGLLYEVVNGLRSRKDSSKIANIPVGVVSGGSGNGLARSIAHYSEESDVYINNPILSSCLAVCRGKILEVNLVEIELDDKIIYSFLSSGWGLLSDIDIESEVIRWLGEERFTIWALFRLARLRSYKATLSFIPWDTCNQPDSANKQLGFENGKEQIVKSDFVSIYSTWQSHIGTTLMFAPASINDGVIHLTYFERSAGVRTAAAFLMAADKGEHIHVSGVKYLTVKEFSLKGEDILDGVLTIDGERVTGKKMTVRMSPRPLLVFSL